MAKFVIECDKCRQPNLANTGLLGLGNRKIQCKCGNVINIQAERMTTKKCPHCGHEVVFDRQKAEKAQCPVCHSKINTNSKKLSFHCPGCKFELSADENAVNYTCSRCGKTIDVQAAIAAEKSFGKVSVIQWDMGPNDVFVYEHPVQNFALGSQLIVQEGQKAIYVKKGGALDCFGPGEHILETQNMPLSNGVIEYPADANLVFSSKVYFVRTNYLNSVEFGIPQIRVLNPGTDFYVEFGLGGSYDIKIKEDDINAPRQFFKSIINTLPGKQNSAALGGGVEYDAAYFRDMFRDRINAFLTERMAGLILDSEINILDLDRYKGGISELLRKEFNDTILNDEYGLVVPEGHFSVTRIIIHNKAEVDIWKKQIADKVLLTREENVKKDVETARQDRILVQEQTEQKKQILRAQGEGEVVKVRSTAKAEASRIEASGESDSVKLRAQGQSEATMLKGQAEAAAYSAQAMAEAEEMKAKGYTYSEETSRQVTKEALKNGLPGTGGSSGGGTASQMTGVLGDVMGLGVGLGMMTSMAGMTQDLMKPIVGTTAQAMQGSADAMQSQNTSEKTTAWNCSCGKLCITSRFCPDCGSPKPSNDGNSGWDCTCGCKGITSKFCPNCGASKNVESGWTCNSCGKKNITTQFCPDCGNKKGE